MPMPIKMDDKEFDSIVAKAIENIPYEIRQYLDNIVISVKKRPSRLMMREMGIPPGECPHHQP